MASENELMSLPSDQDSSGRQFGDEELENLREVITSGTLTTTKGRFGKEFEKDFAKLIEVKYAFLCSSGSAAIHTAIAAINPNPGDEIITTSITDMGALTPILYSGAVPVFAEVDPKTLNVTAPAIEKLVSERTRAIIATHLFGRPCPMKEILEIGRKYNIPVIEDSAQAFLARVGDQYTGAIGDIGCFSLQQGKHITTGEGGIVTTNDDQIARRMYLFINKAWGYGDPNPDHYFLALNYRISELQAAVAVAQLKKLKKSVDARIAAAEMFTEMIADIDGIETPEPDPGSVHVYWKYPITVNEDIIPGGSPAIAERLKEKNIASAPRYIVKPAFMCQIFQEQNTLGKSHFPFNLARREVLNYKAENFPQTTKALRDVLVLPWNERYTENHVRYIAHHLRKAVEDICKSPAGYYARI
jgi:perosamine synthetase